VCYRSERDLVDHPFTATPNNPTFCETGIAGIPSMHRRDPRIFAGMRPSIRVMHGIPWRHPDLRLFEDLGVDHTPILAFRGQVSIVLQDLDLCLSIQGATAQPHPHPATQPIP
jgi:hypothetical protein